MQKLTVLLADDNKQWLNTLKEELRTYPSLDVIAAVDNGKTALDMIKDFNIDVVVTDVVMPEYDGFFLLEGIGKLNKKPPVVIMMSSFCTDAMVSRAAALSATYFLRKPFSSSTLYAKINFFCNYTVPNLSKEPDMFKNNSGDIEVIVSNMIKTVGVPAHIKGYQFLRDAIIWTVKDMEIINAVTKELYPGIAKKYKTTPSRVERAIRHAIEISWQRGDIDTLTGIFGYTVKMNKDKPTNSEFIAMIADKIRLGMKTGEQNVM